MPRNTLTMVLLLLTVSVAGGCGALTANGANKIYEAECAAKDGAKCLYLGARYVKGEGVAADAAHGRELLGQACDLGIAQGCLMLGELLESGAGGPTDGKAAAAAYTKACEAKLEPACAKAKGPEPLGDELSPNEQVAWCGEGKLAQCLGLGAAWMLAGETDEITANAAVYLAKACQAGATAGCALSCELVAKGKGTDSCAVSCDAGNASACLALGQNSEGSAKKQWLEKSCQAGDGATCLELAHALTAPADKPTAKAWLIKGCAADSAAACHELGWSRAAAGDSTAKDILAKACSLGDLESCLLDGITLTDEKDPILEKACAARQAPACFELASHQFVRGEKAWKKALAKAEQACKVQPGAPCFAAAVLAGRMAPAKDPSTKSPKLLEQGCAAGHGRSCRLLAQSASQDTRRELLAKGCDSGDASSCTLAGVSWQGDSDGPKDGLRAMASVAKGCELNDAKACLSHGKLLAEHAYDSVNEQIVAFEKACQLARPEGCREAALRNLEGLSDPKAARRQAISACDKGDPEGCRIAGDLALEGQGGTKDLPGAKQFFEKACDNEIIVACVQRGKLR